VERSFGHKDGTFLSISDKLINMKANGKEN